MEQEKLHNFVKLHANRLFQSHGRDKKRVAYMVQDAGVFPLNIQFTEFDEESIITKYDSTRNSNEYTFTSWTIQQLRTFDVETEILVGINFELFPLALVLKLPKK